MLWTRAARLHGQIIPERFDLAVFLFHRPGRQADAADLRRLRARWDAPRRLLVAELDRPSQPGGGLLRLLGLDPAGSWNIAARAGGPNHWWIQHQALRRPDRPVISALSELENAVDHWQQLGLPEWTESGRRIGREALLDLFGPNPVPDRH